jgi:hypothetical protein
MQDLLDMKSHPSRKRVLRKVCRVMQWHYFGMDWRVSHLRPSELRGKNLWIARYQGARIYLTNAADYLRFPSQSHRTGKLCCPFWCRWADFLSCMKSRNMHNKVLCVVFMFDKWRVCAIICAGQRWNASLVAMPELHRWWQAPAW